MSDRRRPTLPFLPADRRLTTARLDLTPLQVSDAEEMADVLADPALYTVIGGEPPTVDTLSRRYALLTVGQSPDGQEQWLNWVVRLRGDHLTGREDAGRAVGTVQATVSGGGACAEVAWVVATAWQHRGYAAEASQALVGWLRECGVDQVIAHIHPDHAASQAVARRAGLHPTTQVVDGEQRWAWLRAPLDAG